MNPSQTVQAFLDEVKRHEQEATPWPWDEGILYETARASGLISAMGPGCEYHDTESYQQAERRALWDQKLINHFRTAAPKMGLALKYVNDWLRDSIEMHNDRGSQAVLYALKKVQEKIAAILSGGEEGE